VDRGREDPRRLRAAAEDWPIHGSTGYRFVNVLSGVYIDKHAEAHFDRVYQRFTGERASFEEIAIASRHLIMNTTLAAELFMLSNWLARIAGGNRFTRDFTASGLRKALAEIAACFPVYRSYVSARGVSDTDRKWIDWAVKAAKRASRIADPDVFDFVHGVLTLDAAPPKGPRRQRCCASPCATSSSPRRWWRRASRTPRSIATTASSR